MHALVETRDCKRTGMPSRGRMKTLVVEYMWNLPDDESTEKHGFRLSLICSDEVSWRSLASVACACPSEESAPIIFVMRVRLLADAWLAFGHSSVARLPLSMLAETVKKRKLRSSPQMPQMLHFPWACASAVPEPCCNISTPPTSDYRVCENESDCRLEQIQDLLKNHATSIALRASRMHSPDQLGRLATVSGQA